MSALRWTLNALRPSARRTRRRGPLAIATRKTVPRLEPLEPLVLLATLATIVEPPLTLTNVPTNFGPPSIVPAQTLSPSLPLFNPALGTLVDVRLTSTATLSSLVRSQNTSISSSAAVTANLSGTFAINGLNQAITGSLAQSVGPVALSVYTTGAPINFQPPSGVTFNGPPGSSNAMPTATSTQNFTFTDPASLAFYTASASRPTISATMSASAVADASSPGGNLTTTVNTPASGSVLVSYDYIPAPTQNAVPISVTRFGIHRQQTQLVLHLSGTIEPIVANNPAYYHVIAPGPDGKLGTADDVTVPIVQATYTAKPNNVTLIPATRLNIHYSYELVVQYPFDNGQESVLPFGRKVGFGGKLPKAARVK